jgi:hypothetical protein
VKRWPDIRNETVEMEEVLTSLQKTNSWLVDLAANIGSADALVECTSADVPEKGHRTNGFAKSYNADAFYTKAAACYIYKKLQGNGGA